jgi:serine kinase of HPr protein (carbohydrate metabolism regulator)
MILHAGLVSAYAGGNWRGALIEGPTGVGKSDLAMRAQALGLMRIVSDDRTRVWTCEGRLFGACPPAIRGLLEARGLGLVPFADRPLSEISLLVSCRVPGEAIERAPEREDRRMLGVRLPILRLHALEASAPLKIQQALSRLGAWP